MQINICAEPSVHLHLNISGCVIWTTWCAFGRNTESPHLDAARSVSPPLNDAFALSLCTVTEQMRCSLDSGTFLPPGCRNNVVRSVVCTISWRTDKHVVVVDTMWSAADLSCCCCCWHECQLSKQFKARPWGSAACVASPRFSRDPQV